MNRTATNPLTDDDQSRIAELADKGWKARRVGRAIGRKASTVYWHNLGAELPGHQVLAAIAFAAAYEIGVRVMSEADDEKAIAYVAEIVRGYPPIIHEASAQVRRGGSN